MDPKRIVRVDLGSIDRKTAARLLQELDQVAQSEIRRFALRIRSLGWVDRGDLVAMAQVALLESHLTFKGERGMSARGWARRTIRQRLAEAVHGALEAGICLRVMMLTEDGKQLAGVAAYVAARHISLDDLAIEQHGGSGASLSYHDIIADEDAVCPEEHLMQRGEEQALRKALNRLPLREQQILSAELSGQSGAAVGREMGLSRQRVNKHRHDAFQRLKTALG